MMPKSIILSSVALLRAAEIGPYTLTCSTNGFAKYQRTDIDLLCSKVAEIDVVLAIDANNNPKAVTPKDMLDELCAGNRQLTRFLTFGSRTVQ
jgi:hypothetical protein